METEFYQLCREIWQDFMQKTGINFRYNREQFLAEMAKPDNRQRLTDLQEIKMPCQATILLDMDTFTSSAANYFLISDAGYGTVCRKCGGKSLVALLLDDQYLNRLTEKFWLPGIKAYAENYLLSREALWHCFPVPVNPATDLWYCPQCRELHRFAKGPGADVNFDQDKEKPAAD